MATLARSEGKRLRKIRFPGLIRWRTPPGLSWEGVLAGRKALAARWQGLGGGPLPCPGSGANRASWGQCGPLAAMESDWLRPKRGGKLKNGRFERSPGGWPRPDRSGGIARSPDLGGWQCWVAWHRDRRNPGGGLAWAAGMASCFEDARLSSCGSASARATGPREERVPRNAGTGAKLKVCLFTSKLANMISC